MATSPSDQPLYAISVAAELTGVQPQALRDYENKGLLTPHRTSGGTRRYSRFDVDRVHAVSDLLAAGVNLAGARKILELETEIVRLKAELMRFQTDRSSPG